MKNPLIIIIGGLLLVIFIMQVVMFYRIHEKLDQRFALENQLNLSSHQGSNTWEEDANNWNPYQELLQMRNRMEQIFNKSMSKFHNNSNITPLTQIAAIDFKDEKDRYVVTLEVPGADESAIDVALNGRKLNISIKVEGESEQSESDNSSQLLEEFKGEFYRSLTLPGEVNKEKMKTVYNKGILTIILPKK